MGRWRTFQPARFIVSEIQAWAAGERGFGAVESAHQRGPADCGPWDGDRACIEEIAGCMCGARRLADKDDPARVAAMTFRMAPDPGDDGGEVRSEEHTYELQSL